DGNYKLIVPEGASIVFSFIGYATQTIEVGSQSVINVALESDAQALEEVVVTAMGIERSEASLGYSVQEVNADDIAVKDPVSVANSIQGRVAGVQVKSGSGTVGGSSSVLIRGVSSLKGSNQPLYVVDGTPISNYDISANTAGYDYGNGAQDINPDDVESISVLKGAAATTLYGNRGANGVIMITTKSGKAKQGLGVEVNSTTTFDNIYIYPNFQDEYGGGFSLDFPTFTYKPSIHGAIWSTLNGTPYVDTSADESWGPKLEGQEVLHWDSFVPESDSYAQTRPWVANPDNYKNIFNTGLTLSNSVSVQSANEKSSFRASYTNVKQKGIVPNSELKKNIFSFKTTNKIHDRIEVFASANYIKQNTTGRSRFGYSGSGTTVAGAMRIWTQRQVDPERLKLYYSDAIGHQVGWNMENPANNEFNANWTNNPYWVFNNVYAQDVKDRMYGNVGFKLDIIEGLTLTATARTDYYTLNINSRYGSGGKSTDSYSESTRTEYENNFEGILNYSRQINDDLSLDMVIGGNIRYSQLKTSSISTEGGLIIKDFYHISNSNDPAVPASGFAERQTNSIFGTASIGYKDMIYLDFSGRNDWSSTLPVSNNSYFYPAVSSSFLFSELLNDKSILSMGKFRASYAMVGNDTYAYRLYDSYSTILYGPHTTYTVSNTQNNSKLKNETTAEFEFGLETAFLNDRVGAQLTYFNRKAFDQIIPLNFSATSGYSSGWINAGELQNTGIEVLLYGTAVKTDDFSWDISFNYSKYNSKLNSLYGDLEQLEISTVTSAWVVAEVGGEYGIMYAAGGYEYDDQGRKLVDEITGKFVQSGAPEKVGSIMPDFNGGVMNTFNYKGVTLSALIDFQKGGLVYSFANRFAASAGQMPQTVGLNDKGIPMRNDITDGGGVRSDGVYADGTENDIYITPREYFRHSRNFQEEYMYDASFIKLREVKLGYTLPKSIVSKAKLEGASVSIIARNVALLKDHTDGFDPEVVNTISNVQGYEGGSLPSTRSIGFNINLKF
ncbi:MAG: SusC/RagA family TonB-linked outer membrane protein, partial [Bacteroidota bacterium]